ncbi:DUF421 domain-containing protein [Neolewinella lacunae]|uniref:DUF421 domain-containing protein n=1 Tax=Neolewinella lacunae TaxID=1517758 RepID=A0A923PH22_9BACT|nr:YetF domain-containing protein [Neolewinella lacunae]MBC6993930.1 DUF421 domain-containing protein [Neolewinella lacunae]MDN3634989.1 DUF421 domain-containing protein [Neolewinella lacunae]
MENFWFDSWEGLLKVVLTTPLAYAAMVVLLRASGKRTLAKMNAFDFVVTVALGSVLASVALNKSVPLVNGVMAMLIFIGLQFLLTWLSVRIKAVKTLITSRPNLIFYQGSFVESAMKKERLTKEEIYSAARQQGFSTLDGVDMIILETTGDVAIIKKAASAATPVLSNVAMKV